MSLTDEQIKAVYENLCNTTGVSYMTMARAIESAATAPLLERIAELEQRCQDHHEDVVRFRRHALDEKDARMALERELEALRKDAERYRWLTTGDKVYSRFREAYDAWDGSDAKIGFDAAIDAAKGQV